MLTNANIRYNPIDNTLLLTLSFEGVTNLTRVSILTQVYCDAFGFKGENLITSWGWYAGVGLSQVILNSNMDLPL